MSLEQEKAEAELERVYKILEQASNKELAQIHKSVSHVDPFERPEDRLLLPSAKREKALREIKAMIKDGRLSFKRNK